MQVQHTKYNYKAYQIVQLAIMGQQAQLANEPRGLGGAKPPQVKRVAGRILAQVEFDHVGS